MKSNKRFGRESCAERENYDYEHQRRKNKKWQSVGREFRCCHCRQMVFLTNAMATVHRNHCPYCLWSLHVDTKPGNRASLCQASMEPVGLTFKHGGFDKYGHERLGDVMLVHHCKGCSHININRIAGDDSTCRLFEVFEKSLSLEAGLQGAITQGGIRLLETADIEYLQISIYGKRAV